MATSTGRTAKANPVPVGSSEAASTVQALPGKLADRPACPAEKRGNPVPVHAAPEGLRPALTRFELGARRLRVVCVDDVVPKHVAGRPDARTRLVYARGEVAHFDLEGHRYALVDDEDQATDTHAGDGGAPHAADDFRVPLTNRELQIVQLISMGCLTKQVSDRLHISEFTVRSYLKTIYCKLGVRSRGALVYRYAQSFKRTSGPS